MILILIGANRDLKKELSILPIKIIRSESLKGYKGLFWKPMIILTKKRYWKKRQWKKFMIWNAKLQIINEIEISKGNKIRRKRNFPQIELNNLNCSLKFTTYYNWVPMELDKIFTVDQILNWIRSKLKIKSELNGISN